MSDDLKDMLERVVWTFIEAFIGALTIAPLVGIEAETVQLAALSGGAAALADQDRHDTPAGRHGHERGVGREQARHRSARRRNR